MATISVAARIDEDTLKRASFFIDRAGLTNSEVIQIVYANIAETGEVPEREEAPSKGTGARARLDALLAEMPGTSELEQLTDDDVERMLENRDL